MGALHAGQWRWSPRPGGGRTGSRRRSSSIRLQFGAGEDLDRYPRREEEDCADAARTRGCDLLWLPTVERHLSAGLRDHGQRSGVSASAGKARRGPGHFDGVATVVAKLLLAVRPDVALFGEKDFQQLAVIRRMVADLGSRRRDRRRADGARRRTASPCPRAMHILSRRRARSRRSPCRARSRPRAMRSCSGDAGRRRARSSAKQALVDAGFSRIDYFALVDAATLEPLDATGGRHAPDRRGGDRHDAADRQSSPSEPWLIALTISLPFGGRISPSHRDEGTDHGCDQSEERGIPDPQPACRCRSRRRRCVVRAWRDLFDRPRRRSRST